MGNDPTQEIFNRKLHKYQPGEDTSLTGRREVTVFRDEDPPEVELEEIFRLKSVADAALVILETQRTVRYNLQKKHQSIQQTISDILAEINRAIDARDARRLIELRQKLIDGPSKDTAEIEDAKALENTYREDWSRADNAYLDKWEAFFPEALWKTNHE